LRRVLSDGQARVLATREGFADVIAAVRWGDAGPIHLVDRIADGFRVVTFAPDGSQEPTHDFPDHAPLGPVTMDGPGRLAMATEIDDDGDKKAAVFTIAFGLMEPARAIRSAQPMAQLSGLLWMEGVLYAAAGRKVWVLRGLKGVADARTATWYGPVLRSPLGDRSGWLRADLWAVLPRGARVRISSRAFDDTRAAAAYLGALTQAADGPILSDGWTFEAASEHFGDGTERPLRHYLGDETAEYLALRIEVSVPTCAGPARLKRLDVLYPNRSLIDDLPAIYRTGTRSHAERQMRRLLAPFQALADEIDDLIGDGIRRIDPQQTDDLWTGFLLHWLGHGEFARLPADQRRALLIALPEILRLRGTLAGLAKVMEILAPEGFAIEDSGTEPDFWVLPKPMDDPAGARLGRETRAARHQPRALVLGGCTPLGEAVLRYGCLDLNGLAECSGKVTVRVFGDNRARERLEPFTDRIARTFVPANTRIAFTFGDHRPPRRLQRSAGIGPDSDTRTLFTLDDEQSRALGGWRLPREGPAVADHPPVLDSARLDESLTLA
jgi:phage tail-like protein